MNKFGKFLISLAIILFVGVSAYEAFLMEQGPATGYGTLFVLSFISTPLVILGILYGLGSSRVKKVVTTLIIGIPVALFIVSFVFEKPNASKIGANDGCEAFYTNFKVFFNRDYCFMSEAYRNKDVSFCEKIKGESIAKGRGILADGQIISKNACVDEISKIIE
jgi:hypothetical protein